MYIKKKKERKERFSQNSVAQILIHLETRSVVLFVDVLHMRVTIRFFFLPVVLLISLKVLLFYQILAFKVYTDFAFIAN